MASQTMASARSTAARAGRQLLLTAARAGRQLLLIVIKPTTYSSRCSNRLDSWVHACDPDRTQMSVRTRRTSAGGAARQSWIRWFPCRGLIDKPSLILENVHDVRPYSVSGSWSRRVPRQTINARDLHLCAVPAAHTERVIATDPVAFAAKTYEPGVVRGRGISPIRRVSGSQGGEYAWAFMHCCTNGSNRDGTAAEPSAGLVPGSCRWS
jgi:hypothetical protein